MELCPSHLCVRRLLQRGLYLNCQVLIPPLLRLREGCYCGACTWIVKYLSRFSFTFGDPAVIDNVLPTPSEPLPGSSSNYHASPAERPAVIDEGPYDPVDAPAPSAGSSSSSDLALNIPKNGPEPPQSEASSQRDPPSDDLKV